MRLVSSAISASVSPETIVDLDNRVRLDLQQLDDRFFWWVAASAIVVAVGCMMEGPEIFRELWPKAFSCFSGRWVKHVGLIGWLLVVLGVAGEGVLEIYDHHASDLLQTFDEVLLTDTQRNAGGAADAAELATSAANEAGVSASNALVKAKTAEREADSFKRKIDAAENEAARAETDLQASVQRTARLEALLSWRTVTPEQTQKIKAFLNPLRLRFRSPLDGVKITFTYESGNQEEYEYAAELKDSLMTALQGFNPQISEPSSILSVGGQGGPTEGLIMRVSDAKNPGAVALQQAQKLAELPQTER